MPQLPNKVMTAAEAVERFVPDGAVVGMGGLSVARGPIALTHEVVRQGKRDLTLVGCSLNLPMDLMVGAGLVKRTESGSGNMEQFGLAYRWREAVEQGTIDVVDYTHLSMALRFLAGSLGLPFMPSRSLLGSDILERQRDEKLDAFHVMNNPYGEGGPVVLLPAVTPDVSLLHVQKADEMGNVVVEGITTHEPEMAKASSAVIVTCEELISTEEVRRNPTMTTIPYIYVNAVVVQPWGAYPTSCYGYYEDDPEHSWAYQAAARPGGDAYAEYMERYVTGCADFDAFLALAVSDARREELRESMLALL